MLGYLRVAFTLVLKDESGVLVFVVSGARHPMYENSGVRFRQPVHAPNLALLRRTPEFELDLVNVLKAFRDGGWHESFCETSKRHAWQLLSLFWIHLEVHQHVHTKTGRALG